LPNSITPADLQPGDFMFLCRAWVDTQPLDSHWRLVGDAIALGEAVLTHDPEYVHVAMIVGALADTIEELWTGAAQVSEVIDDRWDYGRPAYPDAAARDRAIAFWQAQLGSPYDYPGLAVLGIDRLTGLTLPSAHFICSSLGAGGLRVAGLDYWPGKPTNTIAPCDYQAIAALNYFARAGVMREIAE
jgi:hypothetical protein